MTRRELIIKALAGQLSWVQAADIAGVSARQMRHIRRAIESRGMSAVMDQRGGRPRRKRVSAGTIAMLVRLKRDVYPDFSLRHFYEQVTEKHQIKVQRPGKMRNAGDLLAAAAQRPSEQFQTLRCRDGNAGS